jgi:hypothetical protein
VAPDLARGTVGRLWPGSTPRRAGDLPPPGEALHAGAPGGAEAGEFVLHSPAADVAIGLGSPIMVAAFGKLAARVSATLVPLDSDLDGVGVGEDRLDRDCSV